MAACCKFGWQPTQCGGFGAGAILERDREFFTIRQPIRNADGQGCAEELISGEEGLERARQIKPLAITLDVLMPGMDGWAVLTKLKADPELAETPVIIISIMDDRNLGYSLGATDYLIKPVTDQPAAQAREFFFASGYAPIGIPSLALRAGYRQYY